MTRTRMVRSRFLLIICAAVQFLFTACTNDTEVKEMKRVLPIVGERDIEYKTIDGVEVADTIYHHVPSFEYLNQDSVLISSLVFKSKIWVVDFFFTPCPQICPSMTAQMKRLSDMTVDYRIIWNFLVFLLIQKKISRLV